MKIYWVNHKKFGPVNRTDYGGHLKAEEKVGLKDSEAKQIFSRALEEARRILDEL